MKSMVSGVRSCGFVMLVVFALVIGACHGGPHPLPPTIPTTPPPPAPFAGKNIYWVMADDMGCSTELTEICDTVQAFMPWLAAQAVGGGDWVSFDEALTHNSVCCPNRATFLTGQTSLHNGVLSNSACGKYNEFGYLPTAFQSAGYETAMFGKYLNCFRHPSSKWPNPPTSWDRLRIHNGSPTYYGFEVVDENGGHQSIPQGGLGSYEPFWMRDRSKEFIASVNAQDADQPWLVYLPIFGPHSPASPPPNYSSSYSKPIASLPNHNEGCPGAYDPSIADKPLDTQVGTCKETRDAAKGAIWAVDEVLRDVYQYLAATGELDDTIIVFTGDNGMAYGSHQVAAKACGYKVCHQIPMLMRIPGVPGHHVDRMVSNLDFYASFAEMLGLPVLRPQDGRSFAALLSNAASPFRAEQFVWNQKDGYRGLYEDCHDPTNEVPNGCFALIERVSGEVEFYDMHADPWQLNQLLPNPVTGYPGVAGWTLSHPDVVDLRARLALAFTAGGGTTWP
jgi:arylsulfatase A-like enzyme